MNSSHDDPSGDDFVGGDPFEARLRRDLQTTATTARSTVSWREIAEQSQRRDQTMRWAGGVGLLVVALAVTAWVALSPRPADQVRLESVAAPVTEVVTERVIPQPSRSAQAVPEIIDRPHARLVVSTGEDLQITDLDGVVLETPVWQPTTGAGPVSEVVVHPDGSAVAVWHRDCLVEAGSLVDGQDLQIPHVVDGTPLPTGVDGIADTDGCSGPAVFSPDGTAVAWTSGADGQGRLYTAAWTTGGVDLDTIAAVGEDAIDLANTRLVGWGDDNRLLVRQRRDVGTELYALQVAPREVGGAIAVGDFLIPAFDHMDGRVPVDTDADWVLDVREVVPDGSELGVIDELGIRPVDDISGFSYGGLAANDPIDPLAIWFDARPSEQPGSVRVFGTGNGAGYWLGGDGSTLFGPFPIGAGVTAAAVVPGSEQLITMEPAPPTPPFEATEDDVPEMVKETLPATNEGPQGAPATAWCAERLLAAVITTAGGTLEALCGDGSTVPFGEGNYHHPSLGTDRLLVQHMSPEGGSPAQVVSFDLATGESQVIADGSTPALARNGTAAWLTTGDQIVQSSGAAIDQPVPAGPPMPRYGLMRLTWDRDGRWLFVSLGDPGGPLQVFALDTHDPAAVWQPLVTGAEGDEILAVAGETDTPDAAALLVRNADGEFTVAGVVLAEGSRTLPFPRVMGISPVDGIADMFDANLFFPLIEPIGLTTVPREDPDAGWQPGTSIAWLVGDGRRLWVAGPPGDAIYIRDDVATITVSPALSG